MKSATVKYFNSDRGFGFLLTEENNELWFHAADRRVPRFKYNQWEWLNAHTAEPRIGDMVVYEGGLDATGPRKAAVWGYKYQGIESLINREPVQMNRWAVYQTRKGTVTQPWFEWGMPHSQRIHFEADPDEYRREILEFDAGEHPQHWTKLKEAFDNQRLRNYEPWYLRSLQLEPGEACFSIKTLRTIMDDRALSGCYAHGWAFVEFDTRNSIGAEKSWIRFHRDGTVRIERHYNTKSSDSNAPFSRALCEKIGYEVVEDRRPITAYDAELYAKERFAKKHAVSEERQAELLQELRERFGWEVYPPETQPAAVVHIPVQGVYSELAADSGTAASERIKLAAVAVYDPRQVAEWEALIKDGLKVHLSGTMNGTWMSPSGRHKLPSEGLKDSVVRLTTGGFSDDRCAWELLGWGADATDLEQFLRRFQDLDKRTLTGAIKVVGVDRSGANIIG